LLTFWLILSISLSFCYLYLQLFFVRNWKKIPIDTLTNNSNANVAIIIPARNEAQNISGVIQSILKQNYPKHLLEIIIVDDYSDDNTATFAQQCLQNQEIKYKILSLKDYVKDDIVAYKKSAIEYAVQQTNQEIIITTDADCIMKEDWIASIVNHFVQKNAVLVASPVVLMADKLNIFNRFEMLDFCGMQLITGACIRAKIFNMANGANLAYTRAAFLKVNGYQDIKKQASGDDMLLIYKMAKLDANKIFFLKNTNANTYSKTTDSILSFIQQRFRWTSKATTYQDKRISIMLGIVLFFCISIFLNFFAILGYPIYYAIFPNHSLLGLTNFLNVFLFIFVFCFQFFSKTIVDFYLLKTAVNFFNRKELLQKFLLSEVLHILYIVFIGIFGNFMPYNWKGRKLK
jgi:cellulose synthase/poly-beta-1,6-N-acetylglucosamine synthase-like glycosyltransferase